MTFLRVVEVFPPIIGPDDGDRPRLWQRVEGFISAVKSIRSYCDVVLVADVKNPAVLKFSTVEAAALLQAQVGVNAAPVIVARDSNRPRTLSAILTAYGLGLRSVMLVWGDRYPAGIHARNVYDFRGLSSLIADARATAKRAGAKPRIFAPVDISTLGIARGINIAESRLKAGADLLLAQPPTTDSGPTLSLHRSLIDSSGLKNRVLPGVFPFWNGEDALECSRNFGWNLPRNLYRVAEGGEARITEARQIAQELRRERFPGVYLSTRGRPSLASSILWR